MDLDFSCRQKPEDLGFKIEAESIIREECLKILSLVLIRILALNTANEGDRFSVFCFNDIIIVILF